MAAMSGYCDRVASRAGKRARARSWATNTPATWPATMAMAETNATAVELKTP